MQTIISKISQHVRHIYRKAEDFLEEEREFVLSQIFLNATIQRYVTDNVKVIQDLHADLHDDWLRLYATLDYNGLYTTLAVDLKLVQMELNKDVQFLVFEQISETNVIEARFKNLFQKISFNSAFFYFQKLQKKDPLGMALEKLNIVKIKDDLLYLDLNRWLKKSDAAINTLRKVHINHALLREAEFVLLANVNLAGIFKQEQKNLQESLDDQDSVVSPIYDE